MEILTFEKIHFNMIHIAIIYQYILIDNTMTSIDINWRHLTSIFSFFFICIKCYILINTWLQLLIFHSRNTKKEHLKKEKTNGAKILKCQFDI